MARSYKRKSNGQFAGSSGGSTKARSGAKRAASGGSTKVSTQVQPRSRARGVAPTPSNRAFQKKTNASFSAKKAIRRELIKAAVIGGTGYVVQRSLMNALTTANQQSRAAKASKNVKTTTLTTQRGGMYGSLPKASKPRRGAYKISKF